MASSRALPTTGLPPPRVYDSLSDEPLIERCRAGESGAWATLVRRYQRLVYTVALRAGLPEAAAADVFQTTFTRLFEHLTRIEDASRVRAWLVTTAKRESLAAVAQMRRRVDIGQPGDGDEEGDDGLDRLPDPAPLADERLSELQQHDRLRQAVARLDPRARAFVEFVFLQDEPPSYGEIAARLGIAEGSIGPTRMRCLDKLRKLLADL